MFNSSCRRSVPRVAAAIAFTVLLRGESRNESWPVAGHDLANSRNQPAERRISASNAASLRPKWVFTTGGDVSATPTVADNQVYFPDWAGNLYAVERHSGHQAWSRKISDYNGHPGSFARVSPAIYNGTLIIGDILSGNKAHDGANVMAVNRDDGSLVWITHVDNHPAAVITGSPVVAGNIVYVGVSSNEESLATDPAYPCCSFRGSVVALDAVSGRMLWKTYTVPDNGGAPGGYSGGAVWQPPAIDPAAGVLYFGTGNNYDVPQSVKDCLASADPASQSSCFAPDDYFDAALSLNLRTGAVHWAHRLQGFDVWTVACLTNTNPVACPVPSSPDFDLGGSGPNLLPGLVGFGQKSGIYWALNPSDGSILWSAVAISAPEVCSAESSGVRLRTASGSMWP